MKRFLSIALSIFVTQQLSVLSFVDYAVAREIIQQSGPADVPARNQDKRTPSRSNLELRIPDGTPIEIEAPFTFSSLDFKPKDEISFRVVNPVKISGVTIIEQGATATGRVERAKRGGHFGKAGLLSWTMQTVTAVDGSQIPLRVTPMRQRGDSKSAKVATRMIITGALVPLIAPVALLHGFKRGGDAYIPAGKRFEVVVNGPAIVRVENVPE